MQMGALLAAGFRPVDMLDMTWMQLREAGLCVRAYHTDLVQSFLSGSSPALDGALKAGRVQEQMETLEHDAAVDADTLARANQETHSQFVSAANQSASGAPGSLVKFRTADPSKKAAPDLFAEWERRQAAHREATKKHQG